jgi:hypothetical protein
MLKELPLIYCAMRTSEFRVADLTTLKRSP